MPCSHPPIHAQPVPEFVTKIMQIYDCKVARHGNMIVGKTGSGKSTAWRCLQRALGKLRAAHPDNGDWQRVQVHTINPLALSNDELYGSFEEVSFGPCCACWPCACDDSVLPAAFVPCLCSCTQPCRPTPVRRPHMSGKTACWRASCAQPARTTHQGQKR